MYQSMFLLGVIMFGFFAVSFGNYQDFAEDVTLDNNLERVLQEVSDQIVSLIDTAQNLRGSSSVISVSVQLTLDAEYADSSYRITVDTSANTVALVAVAGGEEQARLPLSYTTSDTPDFNFRQIAFSGSISSSSIDSSITYQFDQSGSPVEAIILA